MIPAEDDVKKELENGRATFEEVDNVEKELSKQIEGVVMKEDKLHEEIERMKEEQRNKIRRRNQQEKAEAAAAAKGKDELSAPLVSKNVKQFPSKEEVGEDTGCCSIQ